MPCTFYFQTIQQLHGWYWEEGHFIQGLVPGKYACGRSTRTNQLHASCGFWAQPTPQIHAVFQFQMCRTPNQALDVMFPVSEELPHIKRTRVSRYEVISFTGSSLVCRQLHNDCQMLIPCEMRQKIKRGNAFWLACHAQTETVRQLEAMIFLRGFIRALTRSWTTQNRRWRIDPPPPTHTHLLRYQEPRIVATSGKKQ